MELRCNGAAPELVLGVARKSSATRGTTMEFDEIIVGSGSSGAVLAARLSEDRGRQVLLIEAGPDYPDLERTPKSLLNGRQQPSDHDWGFTAEMVAGRSTTYPRGKVIGGTSSVNGCVALRGTPADYDEWGALGNSDWNWASVLPVFIRIEDDRDAQGDYHGVGGPIPMRRYAPAELGPVQAAFAGACRQLGFPTAHDHNHPEATGIGFGPFNLRHDSVRISTAIAYLLPARGRPNLSIRSDCLVDRVLFDGNRAIGVEMESHNGPERILGKRVTLSAGTIGTPAILLRSGIGPADDLRTIGIAPKIPLDGVGRNLIDHAGVGFSLDAAPGTVDETTPIAQVLLRYTAPGSCLENDMQAYLLEVLLPQPQQRIRALLVKPNSSGMLRLRSRHPKVQPVIQLNLASEAEDARRLGDGLRLLGKFIQTPQLDPHLARSVNLDDGETVSIGRLGKLLEQSDWVAAHVQSVVRHYVHPVGSARMGPADDPGAVVDQHGRVHGTSGLRVADASIMATIPRANTNLTCIVIGERVAGWMREQDN
jgi:choline dehydrogenase